jgi:putative endonuclease
LELKVNEQRAESMGRRGIRAKLRDEGFYVVIPAPPKKRGRLQPESREPPLDKQPAVYILASQRNGTLYIGVTSDLVKRIWEHKNNLVEGFSKRYGVHQLVWYELHENMESAINREKQIKEWKRKWKLELIEDTNRNWQDLYYTIV